MQTSERIRVDTPEFNLRNGDLSLRLRFNSDVLSTLKLEVGKGFLSIPHRGAEVGGVLEGQITQDGTNLTVTINGICPIPIEYQYGPSYRLSISDRQRFQSLIYERGLHSGLVGWYRSNTRPEPGLDDADRLLTDTLFGGSQSIFLLCQPSVEGEIASTCFLMPPEGHDTAFAFGMGRFSFIESQPQEARGQFPRIPSTSRSPFERRTSDFTRKPPGESNTITRNLAIAAAMFAVGALAFIAGNRPTKVSAEKTPPASTREAVPPPPADPMSLGLNAAYEGNAWMISWKRNSLAVALARAASFTITEHGRIRNLNLSARELQTGRLLYRPSSDQVRIELSVILDTGTPFSESIQIINSTAGGYAASGPRFDGHDADISETPSERLHPAATSPIHVGEQKSPPVREEPSGLPEPLKAIVQAAKSIAPPVAAPAVELASPPANETSLASVAGSDPKETLSPAAQPVLSLPIVPISSIPLTGYVDASAAATPSSAAAPQTSPVRKYSPPTPIRSPQPAWPQNLGLPAYARDRVIEIQVEVTISAAGQVTDAHLAGEAGPYAFGFAASAINTARLWTFHPATLGGEPVESRMTLVFHFSQRR